MKPAFASLLLLGVCLCCVGGGPRLCPAQEAEVASPPAKPNHDPVINHKPLSAWVRDLQSDNASTRYGAAVNVLPVYKRQVQAVVPEIAALLEHDRAEVRATAALALAGLQQVATGAAPALRKSLDDPSRVVQMQAAFALWKIKQQTEPAVRLCLEGLDSDDAHVKRLSFTILTRMQGGAGRAVPALLTKLREGDLATQRSALRCLGAIGPDAEAAIPALVSLLTHDRLNGMVQGTLLNIGPAAIPAMLQELRDDDADRRRKACGLLARLDREGRAAPIPLSRALADPSEQVRLAAARALGQIDSQSVQVLVALVLAARNGDKPLRLASLDSLRRQGAAAAPVLREQLRDDDLAIRQRSVKTLTSLGPAAAGALPELTGLLKSDNRQMQLAAIRCLGAIGREAESAVAPLHELLKPDENASPQEYWESATLRREAAIALTRLGPKARVAIPTLIDILQSPVEGEKRYLNLTGKSSPAALGLMAPIIRTDEHGAYTDTRDAETMYMIAALARFGREASQALPALRKIRDNQQTLPANRKLATEAIRRIRGAK